MLKARFRAELPEDAWIHPVSRAHRTRRSGCSPESRLRRARSRPARCAARTRTRPWPPSPSTRRPARWTAGRGTRAGGWRATGPRTRCSTGSRARSRRRRGSRSRAGRGLRGRSYRRPRAPAGGGIVHVVADGIVAHGLVVVQDLEGSRRPIAHRLRFARLGPVAPHPNQPVLVLATSLIGGDRGGQALEWAIDTCRVQAAGRQERECDEQPPSLPQCSFGPARPYG